MCCIILPPLANYVKSSAAVSNCFKLREPQRLSVSSCLEPHYVSQITTNGRVGSLHLHLRSIQLQSRAKWRAQRLSNAIGGGCLCVETRGLCCPIPLSHLGCEFTRSRQRQVTASTFGRRRKSVWFEVVCGSPSCGSGGAHSSQCQCASLEADLRTGCCCCLAIREARALPQQPNSKLTALPQLFHIVKYGHWNLHWATLSLIFHLMFVHDMLKY